MLASPLVHARALTGERAQLAVGSRRLTDGRWFDSGVRAVNICGKQEENRGCFLFVLSAMRGEQTENGENSTNSVSAKDDGSSINLT